MRYLLCILMALTSAALAQTGTLAAEKTDQIGVFEVSLQQGSLQPGDIVSITRGGKKLGEATVMSCQGSKAVVSLKGVFEAQRGDGVEFARSASAPAEPQPAADPQPQPAVASPEQRPRPGSGNPPPPAAPSPAGRRPTEERCPECKAPLYTTGKQVMEKGRPAEEYVCDSGHTWVKTRATNLGHGRYMCPTCSMPVQAKSNDPLVRDKKVLRCPMGHTFSIAK